MGRLKRVKHILRCGAGAVLWGALALILAPGGQAQTMPAVAQPGVVPAWQPAAGGKMEFEVASVRENRSGGESSSNFSLDSGNVYTVVNKGDASGPNGSYFAATGMPLVRFIIFAYKLSGTQELALRFNYFPGLKTSLPDWVKGARYDIAARAPGTESKDQMRLMMQALLADRFNLQAHWETRQAPVFALVVGRPGKTGPQLLVHAAGEDCASSSGGAQEASAAVAAPKIEKDTGLPALCGVLAHLPPLTPGDIRVGGRDVSMELLATSLPTQTGMATLPRPVIDETGLVGSYDLSVEWSPEPAPASTAGAAPEMPGASTTFVEALKEQLGLKLESTKGPVEILVIDHVERPSDN